MKPAPARKVAADTRMVRAECEAQHGPAHYAFDMAETHPVPWVAAVDMGGSLMKGTLATPAILDLPVRRQPRSATHPVDGLLGMLSELEHQARSSGAGLAAVGVAVPGIVDETLGRVRRAVNLGIENLDLRALLQGELNIPVYVGQDVRCAAIAERSVNEESFGPVTLVVPIGTGIGAAIIVDGQTFAADGYAGEIGHLNVSSGRKCSCGLIGCLETVSSARAISSIYAELSGEPMVDAATVAARAATSDGAAVTAWNGAVDGLATALAACCSVLGVDSVILAGGLSLAGPALIDPLTDALRRRLSFHRRPRLSTAKLTADAGCRGAVLGALSLLGQPDTRPPTATIP
jgi:glucokinase